MKDILDGSKTSKTVDVKAWAFENAIRIVFHNNHQCIFCTVEKRTTKEILPQSSKIPPNGGI